MQPFGAVCQRPMAAGDQGEIGADRGGFQLKQGLTLFDDIALIDQDFGDDPAFEMLDSLDIAAGLDPARRHRDFGAACGGAPYDE